MWLGTTAHEVGTEVVNEEDHHSDGKRRRRYKKIGGGIDRGEREVHTQPDGGLTWVESVDTGGGNHKREPRGDVTQEGDCFLPTANTKVSRFTRNKDGPG